MMNRRRFTAEFNARVALQALKGDKALHEIAANREVGARRSRPTDTTVPVDPVPWRPDLPPG